MPTSLQLPSRVRSRMRSRMRGRLTGAVVAVAALGTVGLAVPAPAQADVTVTPRNFTGYGFDQCLAPSQKAMDAWLTSSPFWAVGIYISGTSRACRSQPHLTRSWVSTQLGNGWRLLPITLGPQASCNPRFPRYSDDVRIDPSSSRNYRAARRQGKAEASDAVAAAKVLGIGKGSTLWYDMEAYDLANTSCRESALWFTSAWTRQLHRDDYVSGVYSSAGSGIRALDDARVERPSTFALPDRIWIARWDGVANTATSYLRGDGWLPGGRVKQYQGGHDETWGGVTINIDRNWLDLGKGSVARREPRHCDGVRLSFRSYPRVTADATGRRVSAVQCLLRQQDYYSGAIDATMNAATRAAVRAMKDERRLGSGTHVGARAWTSLLAEGRERVIKYGAAGERTRRLQRALNAATGADLQVTGVFEESTAAAVKEYQSRLSASRSGVVTRWLWSQLTAGRR